ncbi:3'-5' exonuclease [Nonomuraea sp. NPDC003804]|uniref:3'-5' exonuclease n=1 Tax=Nonomuraea sp. NPDC003804 TaxID=3154547 RepID=UPI0033B35D75
MAKQLAIAKDFLTEYAKLEKPVQRAVQEAIGKFTQHAHAGQHLEKVNNARDPRIRTIRIDRFWRGVVLAPETGEVYCLLRVLPHDDAYDFCASHRFTVNQVLGVLESRDESQLETLTPALRRVADRVPKRLFDGVSDADLRNLGIDEQVLPVIRLLSKEAHLDALQHLLPPLQYDALVALAAGMSPEEVWSEISRNLIDSARPDEVDPDDFAAAITRTPDQVTLIEGPADLQMMLEHPFDAWRVFLHPAQHRIAYREAYRGSVMVSGGAGTGKTVTALHRAAHLAARTPGNREHRPILLTAFSTELTAALEQQLELLIDNVEARQPVEVLNTDKLAFRIVQENLGRSPHVLDVKDLEQRWTQWLNELGSSYRARFLIEEWDNVIIAQDLRTQEEYVACRRHGRREPLAGAERPEVWRIITMFRERMRQRDERTFRQITDEAARLLQDSDSPVYRHVIVDEAQDLHPAQWRLLRAAVPEGPDDLFIVGDPHQRIWEHRVSLKSVGIDVRGARSHRLTINYRTTQEILTWAIQVLGLVQADGLDDLPTSLEGYESPMHGRRPVVRRFPDQESELDAVVEQVRSWLNDGVAAKDIAVTARVRALRDQAINRLESAGIKAVRSGSTGVRVSTMHMTKGLEFRCVAVIGATQKLIPLPSALVPADVDQAAHNESLQRERCLLYVACTRARDRLYVSHSGPPSQFLPR